MKAIDENSMKRVMKYSVEEAPVSLRERVRSEIENSSEGSQLQSTGYVWIIPLGVTLTLLTVLATSSTLTNGIGKLSEFRNAFIQIVYNPIPWVILGAGGILFMMDTLLTRIQGRLTR